MFQRLHFIFFCFLGETIDYGQLGPMNLEDAAAQRSDFHLNLFISNEMIHWFKDIPMLFYKVSREIMIFHQSFQIKYISKLETISKA